MNNNSFIFYSSSPKISFKVIKFLFLLLLSLLRKKGLSLGYKNINLNLFDNDEKILEKSDLIFKTIKEMQIEDIYFL